MNWPGPSWLLLRGLKTLALRIERQSASGLEVADFLTKQAGIRGVFYPGLDSDTANKIHNKQASAGGSVISFTTGDTELSRQIVESTKLCSIAVSFESVNSTISMPCHMSHASIPATLRTRLAPPDDLVRLSVGIEDVDDIIEDLIQAVGNAIETTDIDSRAATK